MPSRNIVKHFDSHAYYHVYNRGVAKSPVFLQAADKQKFLDIMSRHLDFGNSERKSDGTPYRDFSQDLQLLSYCLMRNHFHLLVYQLDDMHVVTDFMRAVCTAYTMYFNRKYKRVGPLFQGNYKCSHITNDAYLLHITRYIHLNPKAYVTFPYSSLRFYLGAPAPVWLNCQQILSQFEGINYAQFIEDYVDQRDLLSDIKHELADA